VARRDRGGIPVEATVSTVRHRVPFYETDGMRIVHHANYVHYLELARIAWLDEHDIPYREYTGQGIHYATTRVELDYRRAARFDDVVEVATWLVWVRGASLRMAYELRCAGELVASGATEHAAVGEEGRPCRLPRERLGNLRPLALGEKGDADLR